MHRSVKPIYVADYYQTKGARELCHDLKEGDNAAIVIMANHMAQFASTLPTNCILIPIPSHTGHATETLALAEQITSLTGHSVANIIKGHHREPLYTIKQKRQTISPQFFGFYTAVTLTDKVPVLIDSVYDTGQTSHSAAKLFKNTSPLILTFAHVKQRS